MVNLHKEKMRNKPNKFLREKMRFNRTYLLIILTNILL